MGQSDQGEFLFVDGDTPRMGVADSEDPLIQEIAVAWGLPVGQRVRVELKTTSPLPELVGRLELASAPEWPWRPHLPLALRIRGCDFSSTQIERWVLAPPSLSA